MRKQYSPELKSRIVQQILSEEKSLSELSKEHGIHHTQLRKWKKIAVEGLPSLFERGVKRRWK